VGQEILNGDVGGGFQGIQITSGFFQIWRAAGITNEVELYWTAIGGLVASGLMLFAGWFHYHKSAPKLEWFQNVESMLNHHLAGLLGLGSLAWAGHQIHVSLPVNKLLDAGVDRIVVMKLFTLSKPFDVIFTLDVTTVLEHVMVVFAFKVTRPLNTVLDGTAPKNDFTVIFFDVGVPLGLSITSSRSSGDVVPKDVS
jgi:hypothetical protein